MSQRRSIIRSASFGCAMLCAVSLASCGGGPGGPGPDGAGQGLVLVSFLQEGVDNVALNTILEWTFSEAVSADSVNTSSIQVRSGPQFGQEPKGTFRVEGSSVFFEPRLAGQCDLSDGGLEGGTQYRVQLVGHPEEFAIKNTAGQPLGTTSTAEFTTLDDNDPERFIDQIPGFGPSVILADATPSNGDQALTVDGTNQIVLRLTENIDPCTVSDATVEFHIYETGDPNGDPAPGTNVYAPNGNLSGFYAGGSTADADPSLFSWGADVSTPWSPAQRVLADIELRQNFAMTQIVITPLSTRFPENALLVVRLSSDIQDYGGQPLSPFAMSFTTQNLPLQNSTYVMRVEGETEFDDANSTSDINSERSPGVIQGYLLFAGDGDNGADELIPGSPNASPACSTPLQANDATKDDFDPDMDVVFNTGATPNTCLNTVDGSTAVVYEFSTFRIASGITVRVTGVNPLILLVQGEVLIEQDGRLLVRGDGANGVPQSRGRTGYAWGARLTTIVAGGVGVAGGGDGGRSTQYLMGNFGKPGFSAYGSTDGLGVELGQGAGDGGTAHQTIYPTSPGTAQGGGGGGHATEGVASTNVLGNAHTNLGAEPTRGTGGSTYPATDTRALTPSAGGGGGAGGNEEWGAQYLGTYSTGGGTGGAGGGFVDITSAGNITILGTIDAAGSAGGSGGASNYQAGPGGGGGGAGGGIRLLTSGNIVLSASTVLTAAGGPGGNSPNGNGGGGGPQNHGGAGGNGRLVLEDSDSVITSLGVAAVTPAEGDPGFFRGIFDPTRFKGGGTMPFAQTAIIPMGPFNPIFASPTAADFVAAVPPIASNGANTTSIFIDARGYEMNPDGTPDLGAPTPWRTVGYFQDSSIENSPAWFPGANPGDVPIPAGNAGGSIANLNGSEFLQLRFTFYLPTTVGPFDPGPLVDDWTIRFTHDQ